MSLLVKSNKGFIFALGSAIIFGTQVLWSRLTEAAGMTTIPFLFYRSLFAWTIMMLTSLKKTASDDQVKIDKKDIVILAIAAVFGMVLTPLLLVGSYTYLNAGAATSLHFSYPLYISLMGIFVFKEKLGKKDVFSLLICMVGIICLFSPGHVSAKGILMALISGVMYGSYTIVLDKSGILNRIPAPRLNRIMYGISTLVQFFVFLIDGDGLRLYPAEVYIVCIVSGILLNVVGVVMFQKGVLLLGGRKAAILSAAEPVTSMIIGVVLFKELIIARELCGSMLIVISSILTIAL